MASYIVVVFIHTPLWPGLPRGGGHPAARLYFPEWFTRSNDQTGRHLSPYLSFFLLLLPVFPLDFILFFSVVEDLWKEMAFEAKRRCKQNERWRTGRRELRGQWREVSVTFQWMGAWMRDCLWSPGWLSCSFFLREGGEEVEVNRCRQKRSCNVFILYSQLCVEDASLGSRPLLCGLFCCPLFSHQRNRERANFVCDYDSERGPRRDD